MPIKVTRRDETTRRLGHGLGDNFHMTWAADDRQLVSVTAGGGWFPGDRGSFDTRLIAIGGGPADAVLQEIDGYPLPRPHTESATYYGFGTLALDRHIYQFLTTCDHPLSVAAGAANSQQRFVGVKLMYSPDNGRAWHNQDGSAPLALEAWKSRTHDNMLFFNESQEAFSILSVLQMGRNYEFNTDGYVYIYAPNGNAEGAMNELVMCRVPKRRILERAAYEFFSGLSPAGDPRWRPDIDARGVVHRFPSGWVNKTTIPQAWTPSVAYNAGLGLYMMVNFGNGTAADGFGYEKPSYLGFWTAPDPWGPWTQIHEETAWLPGGDRAARAFSPQIPAKWIAPDGRSLWLAWSDCRGLRSLIEAFARIEKDPASVQGDPDFVVNLQRRHTPHFGLNMQRVDLG